MMNIFVVKYSYPAICFVDEGLINQKKYPTHPCVRPVSLAWHRMEKKGSRNVVGYRPCWQVYHDWRLLRFKCKLKPYHHPKHGLVSIFMAWSIFGASVRVSFYPRLVANQPSRRDDGPCQVYEGEWKLDKAHGEGEWPVLRQKWI